jgi:hypothetical protein
LAAAAAVALGSGPLLSFAPSAQGSDGTEGFDVKFYVNTTDHTLAADESTPPKTCNIAGKNCSLLAALQSANKIPETGSDGNLKIIITVAEGFTGTISTLNAPPLASNPGKPTAYMATATADTDNLRVHFQITRKNVVIDFKNRLFIKPHPNNPNPAIALHVNAPNVTLRNLKDISSNRTAILFGPNSDGSRLENSDLTNITNYTAKEAILIRPGADNITIADSTFGHDVGVPTDIPNVPASGGSIRLSMRNDTSGRDTIKNLTIDNVTFENAPVGASPACNAYTASGCATSAISAEEDVILDGLTVKNSRFLNFPDSRNVLDLYKAGHNSSDFNIHDNKFINIKGGDSTLYSTIHLPGWRALTGVNSIARNIFDNTGVTSQNHAIRWYGYYSSWTNQPSNLTIENNYFDGYVAQTILINQTGALTVQHNIFGPATGAQSEDTTLEETLGVNAIGQDTPVMFMNYQNTANRRIITWHPTSADVINCVLNVPVEPPASVPNGFGQANTPVRLDFYLTAGNTAETFIGSFDNITSATTVTFDILPDDPVYIRLQTQGSSTTGQLESSQYSRTVLYPGPGDCRTPKTEINLRAWINVDETNGPPTHDSIVTGQTAATEILSTKRLPEGASVWFTYSVFNPTWLLTLRTLLVEDEYGWKCLIPELGPRATQGCLRRMEADEFP